ncbi:flagella basal body P-ring formation protein FlgA [Calditerrivibrio nitroreducens]|uniref:Flagella basal body P-ring formation protein FlgA n=1 Tax=Calditerrivibrio nitroreducens (strain DSM 19672 / NBRC 101217 / Yu37-1) TaxID=768670 RepID=E4TEV5_CALNY|nr:flagella basal body P-ring formation protein FlgA [Calditerrivibrio nitroreducens]ADR18361.1 flagella basal body P-ring formation protein FlgA [Calditerrivibrio nitroreducens DSM 19672]
MIRIITILFLLGCGVAYGQIYYEIDKECFNLRDINVSYPDKNILCNLNFGEERKISTQVIKNYLSKENWDKLPSTSSFVVVKRKGVLVKEDDLKNLFMGYLGKKFPDLTFEIVKVSTGVGITASAIEDISISFPDKPFGTVYVDLSNGIKNYKVYAYIKAFSRGYISDSKIEKGESVLGKIKEVQVEVTNLKDDLFLNNFDAIAIQPIPKNRVITLKMVRQMPEKMKGEKVKVIYNNGTIVLEFEAVLMDDAYKGGRVSVKNLSSDKVLTGIYREGIVYLE